MELEAALKALCSIRDGMLKEAKDDHSKETVERAFVYAVNRLREGSAKTVSEAKLSMASFADGFCTGSHSHGKATCDR